MMMTSHSGIITQSAVQSSNGGVHLKIADWLSKEPRPPQRTEWSAGTASARGPSVKVLAAACPPPEQTSLHLRRTNWQKVR